MMHTCIKTRKSALLVFGFLAVGLLSGCGGDSSNNDDGRSPYFGSYNGTFTTSNNQQGVTSIQVDRDGDVTGTVINSTIGAQGPVTGKISDSGTANITFTYTGLGSADLSGDITYNSADNKLTGNLTQTQNGGTTRTVQVSLKKLP